MVIAMIVIKIYNRISNIDMPKVNVGQLEGQPIRRSHEV